MGLCRQNAEQVMLTPKERTWAMEVLLSLSRKYNGRITASAGLSQKQDLGQRWKELGGRGRGPSLKEDS